MKSTLQNETLSLFVCIPTGLLRISAWSMINASFEINGSYEKLIENYDTGISLRTHVGYLLLHVEKK